jgi:hypothetical protein
VVDIHALTEDAHDIDRVPNAVPKEYQVRADGELAVARADVIRATAFHDTTGQAVERVGKQPKLDYFQVKWIDFT